MLHMRRFRVSSSTAQQKGLTRDDEGYWHYVGYKVLPGQEDRPFIVCDCKGNSEYKLRCSHIKAVEEYVKTHPDPNPVSRGEDYEQTLSDIDRIRQEAAEIDIDALLDDEFIGNDAYRGIEVKNSKTNFVCVNDDDGGEPCRNYGRVVHNMLFDMSGTPICPLCEEELEVESEFVNKQNRT